MTEQASKDIIRMTKPVKVRLHTIRIIPIYFDSDPFVDECCLGAKTLPSHEIHAVLKETSTDFSCMCNNIP